MTNLANHIVCALVDEPQKVKIQLEENNHSTTVQITVAPADMGKIIGKKAQ